jgi:hypothetical protein
VTGRAPYAPLDSTPQHADAPAKFGTRYSIQEREFFRVVVRAGQRPASPRRRPACASAPAAPPCARGGDGARARRWLAAAPQRTLRPWRRRW